MNRIDRLTAILIQLQTKKVVKAQEIADRFEISLRTVYRDVQALMEAGVPIGSEAGKGYFIVDGYHLPPVMFTQDEASAMLLAGKLVEKMGDKSVRQAFDTALQKVKAVLNETEKDHLQNLEPHIEIYLRSRYEHRERDGFPDHFLTEIQRALAKKQVLIIDYSNSKEEVTKREVEPIGIFYYSMTWHLIGWCRLRNDYRDFRSDRIKHLESSSQTFESRNLMSLQEYFNTIFQNNSSLIRVSVLFDKAALGGRPIFGSISQTDLGYRLRVEFMMDNLRHLAHWLLTYGSAVEIESPDELKTIMAELVEELAGYYSGHVGEVSRS
ncbi:MAG: YafY family protein [Cyclobacteriaceae bacterium]|nr:MAG: YafY family protein [Cyclobacteriaceae bacterium]